MANPEHVRLVKQGSEAVNKWIRANPKKKLNLSNARLDNIELTDVDLIGANLTGAYFDGAILAAVDLSDAHLRGATFGQSSLFSVNMQRANMRNVDWLTCSIFDANYSHSNLSGAWFSIVFLSDASFHGAKLAATKIELSHTTDTNFSGTNLSKVRMAYNSISNCNLSGSIGLERTIHEGPSSIGIDTLITTFRSAGDRFTPDVAKFVTNSGVPKEVLRSLEETLKTVKNYNCFVCYGQPDAEFAEKVVKDLRSTGVTCWLYALDSTPGKRTWEEIGQKRRETEKMIALCSAESLLRDGVKKELEDTIDEDPDKLIPISLDNLWLEEGFEVRRGTKDLKPFLTERNFADFSSKSNYNESLKKLLTGLKR